MRRTPLVVALFVPLLVPLLVSCGSDEDDDPTLDVPPVPSGLLTAAPPVSEVPDYTAGDNAPDPCSLLSAAEVSAAVGGTVSSGRLTPAKPPVTGDSCLWSTSAAPARTFQITLTDGGDITVPDLTPEKLFDQSLTTLPGLTPATGVGEKAAFGPAQGLVYSKGVYMLTSVGLGSSDTAGAALRSLTEGAAAKL